MDDQPVAVDRRAGVFDIDCGLGTAVANFALVSAPDQQETR
jgi:hypothetical protein